MFDLPLGCFKLILNGQSIPVFLGTALLQTLLPAFLTLHF
jgi:hypothetical protein